MEIEPILKLFENTYPIPHLFRVLVEIPSEDNYEILSYGDITEDTSTNTFHIDVTIQPYNDGNKQVNIELGDLDAVTVHKDVHVHLQDSSASEAGEGVTNTESAQQESRPVSKDQLPD